MTEQSSEHEEGSPIEILEALSQARGERRQIAGVGDVLVKGIFYGELEEAAARAEAASREKAPATFANYVISCLVSEPRWSPDDVDGFPGHALGELCELAASDLGQGAEYKELDEVSDPRQRLYAAYRLGLSRDTKRLDGASSELLAAWELKLKPFQLPFLDGYRTFLEAMSGTSIVLHHATNTAHVIQALEATSPALEQLRKTSELLANVGATHAPLLERIGSMGSAFADAYSTINFINGPALSRFLEEVSVPDLRSRFLDDALVATRFDAPLIHTLTFPTPTPPPLREDDDPDASRRRRLVRAYDVLVEFEQTMRTLIEEVLATTSGRRWWHERVPEAVREGCELRWRMEGADAQQKPLDFAYPDDLRAIIRRKDNWSIFERILGNPTEVDACFMWVATVRTPIAHARNVADEQYIAFLFGATRLLTAARRTRGSE